jgi:demethylmenaquinone methyltransferase/2-methoxy-6-polyprenyl-1,4-benzoquinol methylase
VTTDKKILQEQIAFYRARAHEYDQSLATRDQLESVKQSLRKIGPFTDIIELACGTGLWTSELVSIGQAVTAIDASPEMVEINRRRVADDRVTYTEADLFSWEPEREYDLLFTAFWLSHVPPDLMGGFLDKIRRVVRSGGSVFIVDQCDDIHDDAQGENEGIFQTRRVDNGRMFTIVKVYYHPELLANTLHQYGFDASAQRIGESFFTILGRRR